MEADQHRIGKRRFLFNVDILIEDETNGRALEKLLHLLNGEEITDYQIKEGIQLGTYIGNIMHETISKPKKQAAAEKARKPEQPQQTTAVPVSPEEKGQAPTERVDPHQAVWDQLQQFKESSTLVRLTIVKAKGVKLSIPCRILNFDPPTENVTVYHVDEKQVYLFKINEIDDFAVSK